MLRQRLHLHIGYHKTGTTSFQKRVSICGQSFNYIGRRYDGSEEDELILKLARAVACNDVDAIKIFTQEVIDLIRKSAFENNLISHENFLRPSDEAHNGLRLFLRLLQRDLDTRVFVSWRPLHALILSRFKHDLGRIIGWRLVERFVPVRTYKFLLRNSIRAQGECNYPYCSGRFIKCHCGFLKKIPLDFYNLAYLQEKIGLPFTLCNFLASDDSNSAELVFGEKHIFPLPRFNEAKSKLSAVKRNELIDEIFVLIRQLHK